MTTKTRADAIERFLLLTLLPDKEACQGHKGCIQFGQKAETRLRQKPRSGPLFRFPQDIRQDRVSNLDLASLKNPNSFGDTETILSCEGPGLVYARRHIALVCER